MTKREQNAYWKGRQYLLRAKAQELYLHHFSLKVKIYQNGGRFQYQRSEVQIQSSAKIYLNRTFVYCQLCIEKTKITKKRPGMAHLKKTIYQKTKNLDMFYSYKNFVTPMRKLLKWLAANVNNNEKNTFQLKHNFY